MVSLFPICPGHKHHKLIPRPTPHDVARASRLQEDIRDRLQEEVTFLMPESVVDQFKPIHISHNHADGQMAALFEANHLFFYKPPVVQAREGIIVCVPPEFCLYPLQGGNVHSNPENTHNLPVVLAENGLDCTQGVFLTVLESDLFLKLLRPSAHERFHISVAAYCLLFLCKAAVGSADSRILFIALVDKEAVAVDR